MQKMFDWIRRNYISPHFAFFTASLLGVVAGVSISSGVLLNPPFATTLVKIDLLQLLAFFLAWSAFLITFTARVVHDSRDTNDRFEEVKRILRENSITDDQVIAQFQDIASDLSRLREENKQLRQENDELKSSTQTE